MNLKTSTSLALKFTLYVIALLLLLGIVVNGAFFYQWYRGEEQKLLNSPRGKQIQQSPNEIVLRTKETIIARLPGLPEKRGEHLTREIMQEENGNRGNGTKGGPRVVRMPLRDNIITLPMSGETLQELTEHNIFGRLSQLDEEWVLFFASEDAKTTRLATVTHFMDTQQRLARIRFLSALFFAGLTFLISRFFVKSALVRLWELTRFVKQIDIHKLGQRLPLQGPQDDEIREISVAINSAIDTIQQQTSSLKDFVSYASHELKTPLMSMNSNLDLAEKTQDFGNLISKQKSLLQRMNELFEKLLLITKHEFHTIELQKQDIIPALEGVIEQILIRFPSKKGDIIFDHPLQLELKTDLSLFESIVSNLVVNACKHTPDGNAIIVTITKEGLVVKDTGIGIAKEDIGNIRERFWKKNSDGNGLGLYLVKLFVEKHGRRTEVVSTSNQGTEITVLF